MIYGTCSISHNLFIPALNHLKQNLMRYSRIVLFALLISSCATSRQKRIDRICQSCPEKVVRDSVYSRTETEVIRFDTITTPGDSAFYFAWMKCQDGSIPAIVKERYVKGGRSHIVASIDSVGKLTTKCDSDSLESIIEIKDKLITKLISKSETKTIVVDLTWWQRALMYLGAFALARWLLLLGVKQFDKRGI